MAAHTKKNVRNWLDYNKHDKSSIVQYCKKKTYLWGDPRIMFLKYKSLYFIYLYFLQFSNLMISPTIHTRCKYWLHVTPIKETEKFDNFYYVWITMWSTKYMWLHPNFTVPSAKHCALQNELPSELTARKWYLLEMIFIVYT